MRWSSRVGDLAKLLFVVRAYTLDRPLQRLTALLSGSISYTTLADSTEGPRERTGMSRREALQAQASGLGDPPTIPDNPETISENNPINIPMTTRAFASQTPEDERLSADEVASIFERMRSTLRQGERTGGGVR
jgi:hypothetical protein